MFTAPVSLYVPWPSVAVNLYVDNKLDQFIINMELNMISLDID